MAVPQATSPQLLTYTNSSASAQGLGVFEAATGQSYVHESADSIHELLGCLYESAHSAEGHSAQVVLGHLTHNAREIFKLIIKFSNRS